MDFMKKFMVGVDEAGRGPLAGPVSVGVVVVEKSFDWSTIPGVADSKILSERKREEVFVYAQELKKQGVLDFCVSLVGAPVIDKIGIVYAVNTAINRSFLKLSLQPYECFVKLDGGLKAPKEFSQETIIRGDALEKVIGLASILAKVHRDRYMIKKANDERFSPYFFEVHKGYGTRKHREAIQQLGLSTLHRKTFCRNCPIS